MGVVGVEMGTAGRCRLEKEQRGVCRKKQREGGGEEETEAPAESLTEDF